MNESKTRPTKKQRELLNFIGEFINTHGYSPSYREIMTGLQYNSVATVALHVNNLIQRGHLRKRDHSARSLEMVEFQDQQKLTTNQVNPIEERWLINKVEHFFRQAEQSASVDENMIQTLTTLIGTLKILTLNGAAGSFTTRLSQLKRTEDIIS